VSILLVVSLQGADKLQYQYHCCEHTHILRALVQHPQGYLEEIQQKTLQSTQEVPGGRLYRKARLYATRRTRAYSTNRYTVVKLCYVTQAYAT